VVYGFLPQSHLGGLAVLVLLAWVATRLDIATLGALTTLVMIGVAALESVLRRRGRPQH